MLEEKPTKPEANSEDLSGQSQKPKVEKYIIMIDNIKYTLDTPTLTGSGILELAGKVPPENYTLWLKLSAGGRKKVGLSETVNFAEHGVEHFTTLPRDQTEG